MSNTAIKELLDDFFMTPSAVSVTGTDMPGLLYLRLIKHACVLVCLIKHTCVLGC